MPSMPSICHPCPSMPSMPIHAHPCHPCYPCPPMPIHATHAHPCHPCHPCHLPGPEPSPKAPKPSPAPLSGSHLDIQGLLLVNAVLPSRQLITNGLAPPSPLAFNISNSSSSLALQNCTISTSCKNLAQFLPWAISLPAEAGVQLAQVRGEAGWRGGQGPADAGGGIIGGEGGAGATHGVHMQGASGGWGAYMGSA